MSKREELVRELRERAIQRCKVAIFSDPPLKPEDMVEWKAAALLSTLDARTVEACAKACETQKWAGDARLKIADHIRALSPEEHAAQNEDDVAYARARYVAEAKAADAEPDPNYPRSGTAPNTQVRRMPSEAARYFQMGLAMVESHNTFDGKSEGQWVEAKNYDTLRQFAEGVARDAERLDLVEKQGITLVCQWKNTGFCGPDGHEWLAHIYAEYRFPKRGLGKTAREAIDAALQAREEGK